MSDRILVTRAAHHALVTLNQPQKRNPLPYLPEHGLLPALERLAKDDAVRAVVLTGAGKAFCSGLDLDGLKTLQAASREENLRDSQAIRSFFETLRNYPKPLLAAVNGPAVAGGAGLALSCDWAVGSEEARFGFSEVKIGFVPALVGVYLARAVGRSTARALLLGARTINAGEALRLHLLDERVEAGRLLERAAECAERLAANSPEALRRTKALLARTEARPLEQALDEAVQANAEARETADCREGVRAFLEKRKPKWNA